MKNSVIKRISVAIITALIGLGTMFSVSTITANAATETNSDTVITEYISNNSNVSSLGIIVGGSTVDHTTYSNDYYCQQINGTYYYWLKADEASITGEINKRKENSAENVGNRVNDITGGLNISADTQTASESLQGFTGVISTLLGILVILITVGMTLFSAFDLCYIAFPVFRNKCEEAKQTGQGPMASSKKTANGETKLRFVSDDAQYAITAADTVQSGKNPFVIYFGKRLISYLVLSALIFILLTGQIDIFTELALKLVSGILDIISRI